MVVVTVAAAEEVELEEQKLLENEEEGEVEEKCEDDGNDRR